MHDVYMAQKVIAMMKITYSLAVIVCCALTLEDVEALVVWYYLASIVSGQQRIVTEA